MGEILNVEKNRYIYFSLWREHEEWLAIVSALDSMDDLTWRNFSVPWHDPALHPSRDPDYSIIEKTYETQISPCDITILIIDLFKSKGRCEVGGKSGPV